MDFNFQNTLILVVTLQGFIFVGVVFFINKSRGESNFDSVCSALGVSLNNLQYHFPNCTIRLESIAFELQLNSDSGHLSRVINSKLNMKISEYHDFLRVAEAKSYLSNLGFENSILAVIGLEAGFIAKPTSYASFKKIMGAAPAQYITQLLSHKISVH